MKLNAPKVVTWWVAVVLGVLGVLGLFTKLPIVGGFSNWLLVAGFALLAIATAVKGL
jgi:hypothetical protein